jgi:hypothetical protein
MVHFLVEQEKLSPRQRRELTKLLPAAKKKKGQKK